MTTTELIERLESAAEGSRSLDNAIRLAVEGSAFGEDPPYTTSLDAALTLVPDDWPRHVGDNRGLLDIYASAKVTANPCGQIRSFTAFAATPALALCIAALKAQETQHG